MSDIAYLGEQDRKALEELRDLLEEIPGEIEALHQCRLCVTEYRIDNNEHVDNAIAIRSHAKSRCKRGPTDAQCRDRRHR